MRDTDPASLIRDLDQALDDAGEDITLRRATGTGGIGFSVKVRAMVRGYDPKDVVGEIKQQDLLFIFSPTEINARKWPGYRTSLSDVDVDHRIPVNGDIILCSRGRMTVQGPGVGRYAQGVLVRIEARARGQ